MIKWLSFAVALGVTFGFGVTGDARATPDDMPIGGPVTAPAGFIEMCRRAPALCVEARNPAPSQLESVQVWAAQALWGSRFAGDLQRRPVLPSLGLDVLERKRTEAVSPSVSPGIMQHLLARFDHLRPSQPDLSETESIRESYVSDLDLDLDLALSRKAAIQAKSLSIRWPGAASGFAGPKPSAPNMTLRPPRFEATLGIDQLNDVNRRINRSIRPASDISVFGQTEYWTVPQGPRAAGDCEDYALSKREVLVGLGVPMEALSLAVVRTRSGVMHTLLLVATPEGEVVLDNLSPWILSWRDAPYVWLKRQAPSSTLSWVEVTSL